VLADYVSLPYGHWLGSPYDALRIDQGMRDWIESTNSAAVARTIFERLPPTDVESQQLLESGQTAACRMSWEEVVIHYLLPGLRRAIK
jgi:hypothetical protein